MQDDEIATSPGKPHLDAEPSAESKIVSNGSRDNSASSVGHQHVSSHVHVGERNPRYGSTPPPTTRFVGDLNPEASMIVEAQAGPEPRRDRHSLGIWLEHEQDQAHDQRIEPTEHIHGANSDALPPQPSDTRPVGSPIDDTPLLPSISAQAALFDLYFSRLHPVLPILDEGQTRKDLGSGTISSSVAQAVCLLASKDAAARPYLRLEVLSATLFTPSHFCSVIYEDLVRGLSQRRERNRYRLIQTLALLSLHTDSGPDGVEDASMHLARAIHLAQTIGIHLGRSRGHRRLYDKLFWCLWSLSIFNAASNGRPRLISDQDVGLKIEDIYEYCNPAFRVMLSLSQLLSRVIGLYQPTSDPQIVGIDYDFPSFEILVDHGQGWNIEPAILTSLELYYHGISILSYRTRSTDDVELAEPSLSCLRQILSSQQVMRVLDHTSLDRLLPLPTIPYAISLALSQTYRQLRRSRSATKRAIAQEQLECYVRALDELKNLFQSAFTMAAIGRRVLMQLQHLNDTAARQAVDATDNRRVVEVAETQRALARPSAAPETFSAPGPAANSEAGDNQYFPSLETFGGFDGLFAGDGTLQAIDTVFDNFMGLDLPNEINASLIDETFGVDFTGHQ